MNPWYFWIPLIILGGAVFLFYMAKRNRDDRARRGKTAEQDLREAEEPENRP